MPLAETGDGGGVDFLVELCAAVVLDTVFDSGDDENKGERKGSGGRGGGSKYGKYCEGSGGECVDRHALTLEDDEGEKVNVGYATKGRECADGGASVVLPVELLKEVLG